jgi:tetratricopeptide (TPR) repeat protein
MTNVESHPDAWDEAALRLVAQWADSGDPGALDAAITLLRHAVDAGSGDRPRYLSHLGTALSYRHRLAGDADSLRAAIDAYREALASAPAGPGLLSNLGEALTRWFEYTDDASVIGEAVSMLRASTAATASGSPYYAGRLSNLGTALARCFERTADSSLLTESIQTHERAIEAGTEDRAGQAALHANLANALVLAFRHTEAAGRLGEAVSEYRRAAALLPTGHPHTAGLLAALGSALVEVSLNDGDGAELVEALAVLRAAVAAAAATPADLPASLAELATALRVLFTVRGDALALEEAIGLLRRAAELTSSRPERTRYRSNLALTMRNRFDYTSDMSSLRDAVQTIRSLLADVPTDHPERKKFQADLANNLHRLGERTGDPAALTEGAGLLRATVAALPAGHRDQAMHLGNLGGLLATAAVVAADVTVLPEAIDALRTAQRLAADRPLDRAGYLLNLGHAHMAEFIQGGDPDGYPRAAAAWREVTDSPACPALLRALAAQNLGVLSSRAGDLDTAAAGFAAAAGLLDLVAWRGLERADQERVLQQFGGLAGAAAACAAATGQLDRAVELLEQSRGVLLAQVMDTRAGYDELSRAEPGLADRLAEIHDALDSARPRASLAGPDGDHRLGAGDSERLRLELATERDRLLEEIRRRPPFTRFLLPPEIELLRTAAGAGPIVTVYVSDHGCGALIITEQGVQLVKLPQLTMATAAEQANTFLGAVRSDDGTANDVLLRVLAWMWDTITGPVLDHLGLADRPEGGPLTRLWWMPTGPLTLLPLHAAGHYDVAGDARSVLDRVVSSYTPTIRALLAARALPRPQSPSAPLVVAVSNPADHPPLACAAAEAESVMARLPAAATLLLDAAATREEVMARLGSSDWAHFACHATTELAHPSESRLMLHDGALRVRELSTLRVAAASLAFLSACTTAFGGSSLPDETIHISSAFLLAGYPSVIGTLWNVSDRISLRIADLTYAGLTSQPPARAVHHAVSEIRRRYSGSPFLWAAHIHLGA